MLKRTVSEIILTLLLIAMLILAFNIQPVKTQSEGELLFFDDFDDGVADGWSPQRGYNWEVIDGQYVSSLGGGRAISIVDNLTFSDGVIETTVRHGGGNPFQDGIVFRYTDDQHYYSFFISDEYDEVRLRIHNESDSHYGLSIIDWAKYPTTETPSHGGGVSYSINPDTVYTLEIRIDGNNFTGYVNGEKILSGIDDDFEVGSVGLSAHRGEVFFNDFTVFAPTSPTIKANVDIYPQTLNLKSKGKWITIYIELPEGYDVSDINATTILLNDTTPIEPHPIAIGDYDNDSIPDLMVKFNRAQVIEYIKANVNMTKLFEERFMTITLTITGKLYDGTPFQGSDTVRIVLHMPRGLGRHIFPI